MTIKNRVMILSLGLFFITTLADPVHLYDPINIPKLTALTAISVFIIYELLWNFRIFDAIKNYRIVILSLIFISWLSLSTLFSKMNLIETLYGVSGRHTGFITYVALNFCMLYAFYISGEKLNLSMVKVLLGTGYFSGIYGLLQIFGKDPFDWINPYSKVFGLFGNPNFHSSFMALSSLGAVTILISKIGSKLIRFLSWTYLPISIINIYYSKSLQGYLGLAAGLSLIFYFQLIKSKFNKFNRFYISIMVIGIIAVILDVLQKSPWKPILYKESLSFRGDFWRAAVNITESNPIFGVGMDGYRDSYRQFRDNVATERNYSVMVDSSHNIFLDISSGGGLPLLVIYLSLQILVIFSFIKIVKRNQNNLVLSGIFSSWVIYQLQSFISINQIGLAVWGWILGGAIVGFEVKSRFTNGKVPESDNSFNKPMNYLAILTSFVLGISLSVPIWKADANFRSAFASGNVNKIVAAAMEWPQSVTKMNLASSILRQNGYQTQALVVARRAVSINPYNFEAWQELSKFESLTIVEKLEAKKNMKRLDPLNPTLP